MSMSRVASMDSISLDTDWEILLPDHKNSSFCMDAECSNGIHGVVGGGGGKDQLLLGAELVVIDMDHFGPTPTSFRPPPYDYSILDEEAKKPLLLLPSEDAYVVGDPTADYYKDIDVVAAEPKPEREDLVSEVTEILVYEAEVQEETIKSVREADQDDDVLVEADGVSQCAREEEEEEEEGAGKTGFDVGSLLRVNGVGALCSFGVAAATFCIMLLGDGGKQQQQLQKRQGHKIHLQHMYPGDEMIQQAGSMMNQTMSSVMGGASSARASISFGGYYQGF